eukprot:jgi/Mesvir1/3560/Mv12026-RA.1
MDALPALVDLKAALERLAQHAAVTEVGASLGMAPATVVLVAGGAVCCLILVLLSILLSAVRGGSKRDTFLLLGLCGAGKTSLFLKLRDGNTRNGTVTSMAANKGCFLLASEQKGGQRGGRPVRIVDVPGHPRLQALVEGELATGTVRALLLLVDAAEFTQNRHSVAERLYDVLTMPQVARSRLPLLVACNKMDKPNAASVGHISKMIEKEISKLRKTKHSLSETEAGGGKKGAQLGGEGEFSFSHIRNEVSFQGISVAEGQLEPVEAFIRKHFPR